MPSGFEDYYMFTTPVGQEGMGGAGTTGGDVGGTGGDVGGTGGAGGTGTGGTATLRVAGSQTFLDDLVRGLSVQAEALPWAARHSDADCGEEVDGEAIVARGDAAEVLEPTEHPFDEIATLVGSGVVRVWMLAGRIWRNDRLGTAFSKPITQASGVVGSIRDET